MFLNCTNLTTAPVLRASALVDGCYKEMFKSCSSLTSVTCLATEVESIGGNHPLLDWLLLTSAGTIYAKSGTEESFWNNTSPTGAGNYK